jgi:FAD:protein FMN transferase
MMETIVEYALGTTITITANDVSRVLKEVFRFEGILTRFQDSPLTQLNRDLTLGHPPIELVEALNHALEVAVRTNGLITPCVLRALEHAGYNRPWNENEPFEVCDTPVLPVPSWQGIRVSDDRIALPIETQIDLGGTAKTWIVERVAAQLEGDFVLDFGGDIFVRQSKDFSINIQTADEQPLGIELPAGAWGICTSSTKRRAWQGGHHLIDPRTAKPLASAFVQVTAVSSRPTTAEVIGKLAFFGADQVRPFEHEIQVLLAIDQTHNLIEWSNSRFTAFTE